MKRDRYFARTELHENGLPYWPATLWCSEGIVDRTVEQSNELYRAAATRNLKIIDTGVTRILWKKNREIKNLANSHPIWHDAKHRLLDHSLSKQKQRTSAETSRDKPIQGAPSYLSSLSPSEHGEVGSVV